MSRMSNISAIEQVLEMIEGYDENAEHNHAGMKFIQGVILGLSMGCTWIRCITNYHDCYWYIPI